MTVGPGRLLLALFVDGPRRCQLLPRAGLARSHVTRHFTLLVAGERCLAEREVEAGTEGLERPARTGVGRVAERPTLEVDARRTDARAVVDRLLTRGLLSKDTHGTVVRFAPPLMIEKAEIDWAVEQVRAVFAELGTGMRRAA